MIVYSVHTLETVSKDLSTRIDRSYQQSVFPTYEKNSTFHRKSLRKPFKSLEWTFHPKSLLFHFALLFVSHLREIGPNVLGYQSHLLQRCHPASGHEGSSISPWFSSYIFFIAIQVQHLQLVNQSLNFTCSRSHAFCYGSQNTNSGFHKNRTNSLLDFCTLFMCFIDL